MNIKITHNWLLEYLDTKATPEQIQKYLSLCGPSIEKVEKVNDDYIYDIEITSNRIDTASVIGIAREAYAILNRFGIKTRFKPYEPKVSQLTKSSLPIEIVDKSQLCRRLLTVVMDNVSLKSSPKNVQDRLAAADIRSLNNVVDVTNYVMTEIGHPTHVFDYDRIKTHKLIIRNAKKGEEIITLDNKKYHLDDEDIIIDDGTGKIIDLPGIMGTANSVVTPETKRILFFIESNNPIAIRRSSIRYGIRTVAATINEKSPDPEAAKLALMRGIDLFNQLAGAQIASGIIDIYPHPQKKKILDLNYVIFEKLIGIKLDKKVIDDILTYLGFIILRSHHDRGEIVKFDVPLYRINDINIPEDLVEEVARVYGYQNLPNNLQPPAYVNQPKEMEQLFTIEAKIKYFLKHLGLHEVINYSMISKEMIENNQSTGDLKIAPTQNYLELKNTISEEIRYLRAHMTPTLIKNIKDNEGKEEILKLFEIAKTYKPRVDDLPIEEYKVGIVTNTDFYDLKGIVDALMQELNIGDTDDLKFSPTNRHPILIENKQGKITVKDDWIGEFGQVKTEYQMKNGVKSDIFMAVFDLSKLIKYSKPIGHYRPINTYATVKLDLTIEPKKTYAEIKKISFNTSRLLTNIEFIGQYENKINLRFYFSASDRNLTEEAAKGELAKIKTALSLISD